VNNEEQVRQEITDRFGLTAETCKVARARRVWAEIAYDRFRDLFVHAVQSMNFSHLCTITGLDEGETFGFIYHLARPDGLVLNLKTRVSKTAPVIKTILDIFPGGLIYERELVDLLGVQVEGLPPGKRYPLPDNWPVGQYPLRKEWKADMLDKSGGPKGEEKSHA
jgi:membrane-bound hydrogenase subunit beta